MKVLNLALILTSFNGFATSSGTLSECEARISQIFARIPTQEIQVEALNLKDSKEIRRDVYHMGQKDLCGIEFSKESSLLTITQFKVQEDGQNFRDVVKFESISLNGNDPTRTNGRIKGTASCSIQDDNITYTTKVPVLTDGVKSPYALEELKLTIKDKVMDVKLRASLIPINGIFRSITSCKFDL